RTRSVQTEPETEPGPPSSVSWCLLSISGAAGVFISPVFCCPSGICLDLVSEGQVGKSVLLPCNSTKSPPVDVFWRDEKENNVLDIIQDKPDLENQDKKYKGRVSSFPSQFQNKNYSIVLEKLEKNDAGNYKCSIVSDGDRVTTRVNLTVSQTAAGLLFCITALAQPR
uniref:Ig-like domain-containing protein n=1 Tax=Fundulus heteroclitus TaxID=8078 RepID=A0A3Q2P6H7_FUNHE